MLQTRKATHAEVLARISNSEKIGFRGFMRELSCSNTKSGVKHVQRFVGKTVVENGQPFVMSRGEKHPLTGTVIILSEGKEYVVDLRIDSPYLP